MCDCLQFFHYLKTPGENGGVLNYVHGVWFGIFCSLWPTVTGYTQAFLVPAAHKRCWMHKITSLQYGIWPRDVSSSRT